MESADVSGRNATEVGSLTLNLAEFVNAAGAPQDVKRPLKTSSAVTSLVGDPLLTCTIR